MTVSHWFLCHLGLHCRSSHSFPHSFDHAFLLIHNKVTIFEKCQDVHLPFESLIVASLPFRFDVCQRSMTASGSLLDLQTKNGSRIIVQKWHGPYIAQKVEFHGLVCVIQRVGPLQVLHVCQGGCSEEIICHSFALPSDDSIVTQQDCHS